MRRLFKAAHRDGVAEARKLIGRGGLRDDFKER